MGARKRRAPRAQNRFGGSKAPRPTYNSPILFGWAGSGSANDLGAADPTIRQSVDWCSAKTAVKFGESGFLRLVVTNHGDTEATEVIKYS